MASPKTKRLVELARKCQKVAVLGRRRNPLSSSASRPSKGHFVVYTRDERRFMVPLAYLNSSIFKELFRMSEEEFGLPGNRPITLSCDAVFMEFVIASLRRRVSEEVEKALVNTIVAGRCSASTSPCQGQRQQHPLLHGF